MKFVIPLLLCLSLQPFEQVSAKLESIENKIYHPHVGKSTKLVFSSTSLTQVLKKYYSIKVDKLKAELKGETISIEIPGLGEINPKIRKTVEDLVRNKLNIFFDTSMDKWLKGFKRTKSSKKWTTFEDISGLNEVTEIKIKNMFPYLKIIEKKATGTFITELKYEKTKWSKGKYTLSKIEQNIYEGTYSLNIHSTILYKKINKKWLPYKLLSKTVQEIPDAKGSKIERIINEQFIIHKIE